METGYQLVPPSRSYSPRPTEEVPQIAKAVSEVSDAVISAADEIVEELGEMISPSSHSEDYAEAAWQRKLRYQANRKKKRGRGL
jgi:mobilization protein